jgi:predicted PurR-regulated permease PerM
LTQQLPKSFQAIRDYLSQYEWGRHLLENAAPTAASLATEFSRQTGLVSGVERFIVGVIVILFVGLFGAAEPAVYREGFLHVIPPGQRRRAGEAIDAVAYNLRWWLVGQVMLMVMMWITTTLGLWLIGIPLAVALGVIAGVFEIVPYAGPWLSAVPALLIALLLSPFHLAAVAALYLALHVVEGYLLAPLVQRGVAEIPPAVTLVAQVLMGELLGILGLLVAAPLTVAAVVLLKMLYVEDTLGDQGVEVPGERCGDEKAAARGA